MESKGAVGSEGYPVTDTISFEGGTGSILWSLLHARKSIFARKIGKPHERDRALVWNNRVVATGTPLQAQP